jgi:hypothetical protein
MSIAFQFDGYDFSVITLTEYGVVTPSQFEIQQTVNGIIATAQKYLYGPFIRALIYGMPPEPTQESLLYDAFGRSEWKVEEFYKNLQIAEEAGLVPTLLVCKPAINLDSDEAAAVFAAPRRFRDQADLIGE